MNRIAIHSVPRSGSTWLGQIFNSSPEVCYRYQPLFSYAFKDRLNATSTRQQIEQFFLEISQSDDSFLNQSEAVSGGFCPRFATSARPLACVYKEVRYHHLLKNLLTQDPGLRAIGIVRNPLAVLASWRRAPREFKPEWDFCQEWQLAALKNDGRLENFYGFQKWKEVATLFQELETAFPERFRLVKYDDLLADTLYVVSGLFEFCELKMGPNTRQFLNSSRQSNHPNAYAVYKTRSIDDDWQGQLPETVVEQVGKELTGGPLACFMGSIGS